MKNRVVKIVITVPEKQAEKVRIAMGRAGAGKSKDYTFCSYTQKGVGRFFPQETANPTLGKKGELIQVKEDRIETFCQEKDLKKVIETIKKVHPYEQPVIDVYPLLYDPLRLGRK